MADTTSRYIQDQSSGKVYDTAGGFLDPVSSTKGLSGVLAVPNANDYLLKSFQSQAKARYQPTLDMADNQLQLGNAQLDQQAVDTNRQYDALGQQLADAAKAATGGIQSDIGRYGFLGSGAEQAGLGKVQSDLSKNTANASADRASQLAQLALQRAGLANTAATQKAQVGQSIQDMVSQLLSGADAATKLTPMDLGNRVVMLDSHGNVRQSFAKGSLSTSGSGNYNLNTAAGRSAALNDLVASKMSSGDVRIQAGDKGTMTREDLIKQLQQAGLGVDTQAIKDAVYGYTRNANEGAYAPGGKTTAAAQQVQTNIGVAQQALKALQDASSAINVAGSRTGSDYYSQSLRNTFAQKSGTDPNVVQLGLQGQAILTAVRALTNTGRISQSEISAIQLPTIYDTKTEAQTKIASLQALLNKAAGTTAPTAKAPTSGKTSSGISFTVTP